MALSSSTLATELAALTPTDTPGAAEQTLAMAYGEYMKAAEAGGVPIFASAVDSLAVPAMVGAMAFSLGSAADGAAVIVAGVSAFWSAMVGAPASFFATATAITAPPFATLAADLAATFVANVITSATLEQATSAMASDIHLATAGQGTATFPGPVTSPIV